METDISTLLAAIDASQSFAEVRTHACLPEPDGDEGYLFVSYSHADYKAVIPDVIRLKAEGLAIWYDRGLESGKSWLGEVRKKISSYECRGVLFYISEAFLASPSCMQELCHYLGTTDRSCLFLLVDGERTTLAERLIKAIRLHTEEAEHGPLLTALAAALGKSPCLPITAPAKEKAKRTKRFAAPALLTYGRVSSGGNPILAFLHLGSVSVTGVLDKNLRTLKIPRYTRLGKRLYRVRGIASGAFFGCEMLEEVEMPRFRYIEHAAFVHCPSLRHVRLTRAACFLGLSTLGIVGDALDGCPNARLSVEGGRTIFSSSFRGRTDLTEMTLPRRQYFAEDAFAGCTALKEVRIKRHDQCKNRTFAGCTALSAARIPKNNVTRRLISTFAGCTSLSEVSLPRRLRIIDDYAFLDCTALASITLPPGVKAIRDTAFAGCTALSTVTLCGRVDRLLENTPYHRRQPLDRLFPHAERFYLKKPPMGEPFDGVFCRVESDRRGYILYVKEGTR